MADATQTLKLDDCDELLLRGALLESSAAVDAWQAWRKATDGQQLDITQRRLLPILHDNLRRHGVTDPVLDQYQRTERVFHAQNLLIYRQAAAELRALGAMNIRTLVMKGVPLSRLYYARPGLRPMSDIDVLVDPAAVPAATRHFLGKGWTCADSYIDNFDRLHEIIAVRNGFNLCGPAGQTVDLHWNVFATCFGDAQGLWEAAEPFDLDGCTTSTLCATDHLLHACAQAAGWNIVRPIRAFADALAIIRTGRVNWPRLRDTALHFELVEPVRDTLRLLTAFVRLDVPEEFLAELGVHRAGIAARVDYRLSARPPIPLIGRPLQRYFRYLRTGRPLGLSFARYMQQLWGISSLFRLVKLGAKRVYHTSRDKTAR